MSKNNKSWEKIYNDLQIKKHDFNKSPFIINANQIKVCVKDFDKTSEKEVRVLCKQDSITLFFEKRGHEFLIWEFGFNDILNYNSIFLKNNAKFKINGKNL